MQSFPLEICIDSIVGQCTLKLIVIKLLKYSNLKNIYVYIFLFKLYMKFFVDALQTLFMHVYVKRNILKIEYSVGENCYIYTNLAF